MLMTEAFEMDRRAMMERVMFLIGATAASGLTSEALAKVAVKKKRFFPTAQFSLMSAVADTLVPTTDTPGAVAAGVPATFDALLGNWASANTKQLLTGALASIDKLATDSDKKGFAALSPARRTALLIQHEKSALKTVPRTDKLVGLAAMMAGPSVADPGYAKLKDLLVSTYYLTEIALTKELIYEHVPGPFVPSLKITSETHAFAGVGLL
jgi:gluconate 2-dehydrogenase gamma chain